MLVAFCSIFPLSGIPKPSKLILVAIAVAIMAPAASGQKVYAQNAAVLVQPTGVLANQVQQELDQEARHERVWWYSWMGLNSAGMVGSGISAGLEDHHDSRADDGVGAASAFLGVIGTLISTLPQIDTAAETLRAMPSEGEEANRARDQAAITLREQAANVERNERSWVAHALTFGVAAGSALVLGLGFDRGAGPAARMFGANFVFGELQIWTGPAALIGTSPGSVASASADVPVAPQKTLSLASNGQLLRLKLGF